GICASAAQRPAFFAARRRSRRHCRFPRDLLILIFFLILISFAEILASCRCAARLTLRLRLGLALRLRMKIRPAERDDLPQILEIYNEAVLNTTASYDYEPRTLEHRIAWYEDHLKNNYPIFVAQSLAAQGRVVGWSALNPFHSRIGYR